MTILGIETSCDETAAAIIKDGQTIVSSVTATSLDIHIKYGGIVPDKAAREQLASILPIIHESLAAANLKVNDIDAIAVTVGPGLIGSLLIGVETAKTLATVWNKPLIPVNHLVGHIYANWLTKNESTTAYVLNQTPPALPALVLLVSGGHSEIILMEKKGKQHTFKLLGSTQDDAAGECFDKCGRLLGLPYPYGPHIDKLAREYELGKSPTISLPRPLIHSKDLRLSFSGLKTAFLTEYQTAQKNGRLTDAFKIALAYELQEAITDVLTAKFLSAIKSTRPKSLIIAGGVAANLKLREKLEFMVEAEKLNLPLHIPDIKLCTDNAAYIASAAFFHQDIKPIMSVDANPALNFSS